MPDIRESKILIMATNGFEQSELQVPLERLRAAGATVEVAAPEAGEIRGWAEKDWGDTVPVDKRLEQVRVEDYDALVLPGGVINPDTLRTRPRAVEIVRGFMDVSKPVAAICHGPWLLAEADVLEGRRITSYRSVRTDMINAGAQWVDEAVVVDNGLITSRSPADLDAFVPKIIEEIREGQRHHAQHATLATTAAAIPAEE
jgi:protease I